MEIIGFEKIKFLNKNKQPVTDWGLYALFCM